MTEMDFASTYPDGARLAAEGLVSRRLAARLHIVTDPPLPPALRKLAEQALASRVTCEGIGLGAGAEGLAIALENHGIAADLAESIVAGLVAHGSLGPDGGGIGGPAADAVLAGVVGGLARS